MYNASVYKNLHTALNKGFSCIRSISSYAGVHEVAEKRLHLGLITQYTYQSHSVDR